MNLIGEAEGRGSYVTDTFDEVAFLADLVLCNRKRDSSKNEKTLRCVRCEI